MEKKYFTSSDYNKFTSNILDAKITQKKLVNESGLDEKIKALATKEEIKTLATKAELKVEQDKIVKLQTYGLSLFIGQSYFGYDGTQNYLVFQPLYDFFKSIGNKDNISAWKSKGLSEETIKPPATSNNSIARSLNFINDKM